MELLDDGPPIVHVIGHNINETRTMYEWQMYSRWGDFYHSLVQNGAKSQLHTHVYTLHCRNIAHAKSENFEV